VGTDGKPGLRGFVLRELADPAGLDPERAKDFLSAPPEHTDTAAAGLPCSPPTRVSHSLGSSARA